MALSPPFRLRHLMLLEAACWHGSSHLLLLLLEGGNGRRSVTGNPRKKRELATNLLNFSLVLSFQGSSPLSAGDAILLVADAAAHLRGVEGRWLFESREDRGTREKIDASAGVVTS